MPARLEMLLDMPTVNRCCIFFIRQHRVDHLLQGDSSEARLEFWRQIVEHFCQGQLQHLQHGHDWSASLFSSKASPSRFRRTTSWLSTDTLWHRAPTVSEQRFPETNLLHKYKFIKHFQKISFANTKYAHRHLRRISTQGWLWTRPSRLWTVLVNTAGLLRIALDANLMRFHMTNVNWYLMRVCSSMTIHKTNHLKINANLICSARDPRCCWCRNHGRPSSLCWISSMLFTIVITVTATIIDIMVIDIMVIVIMMILPVADW